MDMYNHKADGPFTIKANFQNVGTESIKNIDASYKIDDGDWITETVQISTISAGNSGTVSHPVKWDPETLGKHTIYFKIENPEGNIDEVADDDETSREVVVFDKSESKRALVETFTASTCPPCKPGNERLHQVEDQFQPTEYVNLKYQYNFPGAGDPYYTLEGRDRGTYYGGITSVPSTIINGGDKMNPNVMTVGILQSQTSLLSFVNVKAKAEMVWKDNAKISVDVTPYIDLPAGIKLHAAIVEIVTHQNQATNGEHEFFNVLKKFVWGSAGKTLPAIGKEETHTESGNFQFSGNYRRPANAQQANIINWNTEHSVENFYNLGVVVFIQDNMTKEVLQSTFTSIDMFTSANQTDLQKSLVVFPNPTNDMIYVNYNRADDTKVTIRNIQGSVVYEGDFNFASGVNTFSYDTNNLANGVYTITLDYQGATVTQRVVVTH